MAAFERTECKHLNILNKGKDKCCPRTDYEETEGE